MTESIFKKVVSAVGGKGELPKGVAKKIITLFAAAISIYHLYALIVGTYELRVLRPIHLCSLLALAFLTHSSKKKSDGVSVIDIILVLLSLSAMIYMILPDHVDRFIYRSALADPLTKADIFFGLVIILLTLEVSRRVMGSWLAGLTAAFLLYGYLGPDLPGMWGHRGLSIPMLIDESVYTLEGIWSVPIGVASTYVILFIVFGQFLLLAGGGEFFTNFAQAIMGSSRGGPAKVAVVASAFFGTISGSASANVATTGSFTIPMMIKIGYRPHFAAAVEAVASTGGLITPPVMAATLFLMSEITGIPYVKICLSAAVPAFLYYLACIIQIHLEAVKTGISGIAREELPSLRRTLWERGQFLIPLIVVVWVLVAGFTPIRAALWAILFTLLVSFLRSETRMGLFLILKALAQGARSTIIVTQGCALAGIIMGITFQTGLADKFSSSVLAISGHHFLLSLLLAMLACLLLGLALPITASYILTVLLIVPAAIQMGVPVMAAHLFVIYYAVLAVITPPAGAAFFVAAALAGASPMKVGFTAMRLAIAGFIIPFFFVYQPSLLMVGSWKEILIEVSTSIIGIAALAVAVEGWLLRETSILERLLIFIGGCVLIYPGLETDVIGLSLLSLGVALQCVKIRTLRTI